MGAWGYGMLSNDSAQDALYRHQTEMQRIVNAKGRGLFPFLQRLIKRVHRDSDAQLSLFGVCQAFLNEGLRFPDNAIRLLWPYLGKSMTEASQWDDPAAAVKALGHFARHLVDPSAAALTKRDDKSLISAIKKHM